MNQNISEDFGRIFKNSCVVYKPTENAYKRLNPNSIPLKWWVFAVRQTSSLWKNMIKTFSSGFICDKKAEKEGSNRREHKSEKF